MDRGRMILVPGFLGSKLHYHDSWGGTTTLWMNPFVLAQGWMPRLRLPLPGEQVSGPQPAELMPGKPMGAYYGPFAHGMTRRGWTVIQPYADFRRELSYDGWILLQLIRQEYEHGPVNIVCHSRGGLLVRWCLAEMEKTNELHKIRAVVGLGVPHLGSLSAVQLMGNWHPFVGQLARLGNELPERWRRATTRDVIQEMVLTWPSPYHLLPDPRRSWLPGRQAELLYDESPWQNVKHKPSLPHLLAARDAWQKLTPVLDRVRWVDVVGYGSLTPYAIPDFSKVAEDLSQTFTFEGDGTVPVVSAGQSPRLRISIPCRHDALPLDGRLWDLIDLAFHNQLTQDVKILGGVLTIG